MAYLTIGFPKKYRLPEEDGPASILKLDQDEKYLLAVCGRNLVVWNGGRSRVILGIVSVCDDDVLAGADWSFVKGQIICVSRQGEVYIVKYSQVAGTSRLSTSDRGVDHQNPLHIASKNETARLDLKVERLASVFPDDNGTAVDFVTSLSACPAGLLIGTSRGILSCLSVDGDVIWRIKIPDFLQLSETVRKLGLLQRVASSDVATGEILHQDENQSFGGILKLDFNSKLEICGVVLGNGLAFLLSFPDGAVTPPELSQTRWLECVDVTSLALESRCDLLSRIL
uniref:Uncharacterized protein n=1 Tax=Rhodosorus marinus TaxID=101924 RepID=A0A7S2ZR82_9RHOD|mmetsp:Transcript_2964/g.13983  ORF Transcript_2964/g.13983 Transcript_2964/m.13983 type:complete len:284 (+) Transcript_2964:83-934(+)